MRRHLRQAISTSTTTQATDVAEAPALNPDVKQPAAEPSTSGARTITITSVSGLIAELEKLDYVKKGLWYRGTGNSSYALLPSLFRNSRAQDQTSLKGLEHDLNEMFRIRSVPYTSAALSAEDDWERLFFMQHYRVPTRLLDWSGSPLVSLHFAVTSARTGVNGEAESDVAVWALDPVSWNNAAYANTGFPGGVLSARDNWLKRYAPNEVYTQATGLPPVALRGTHNSPRIVAQQGYFTVFGPRPDAMEKTYADAANPYPKDCLVKFVVPRNYVLAVRQEIFALGISESTIYPDLEGLAAELKRLFGF